MSHALSEAEIRKEKERLRAIETNFRTTTIRDFAISRAAEMGDTLFLNVFDRGETATYAEADRASNRIANALVAVGVKKGDRVAIMLPNRVLYPLLFLAFAKIGAVHVPVNTRYTPREIAYVTGDSGACAFVIDPAHLDTLAAVEEKDRLPGIILVPDGGNRAGQVDFDALVNAQSGNAPDDPGLNADDLMNIQYTSGTTGFPKGCMLTHDYWMVLATGAAHWDGFEQDWPGRLLTAQPFFYMDPQWHLIKAMIQRASLFIAPGLSEPRRDCRRHFGLSHAAMAGSSSIA